MGNEITNFAKIRESFLLPLSEDACPEKLCKGGLVAQQDGKCRVQISMYECPMKALPPGWTSFVDPLENVTYFVDQKGQKGTIHPGKPHCAGLRLPYSEAKAMAF